MLNALKAPINRLRRFAPRPAKPRAVDAPEAPRPPANSKEAVVPADPSISDAPTSAPCAACSRESLKVGHATLDAELLRSVSHSMIGRWYPVAREEYGYGDQSIFVCTACGHVFIYPVLSDQDTIDIVFKACDAVPPRSAAWQPAPTALKPPGAWTTAIRVPSLDDTLRPFLNRAVRVLDVGAHGGDISLNLSLPAGSSVDLLQLENCGACVAPDNIDLSRVREFYGLLSDLRSAHPDYRADVILVLQVLEHVADLGAFLTDCRGMLAADGVLVVEVPYEPLDALRVARSQYFQLAHHSYFTPWTLRSLLENNGFEVRQIELLNHSHTGVGTDPYVNTRAVCGVRPATDPPVSASNGYNFCRSLDFLLGSFGGSIAFLAGAPFVTFHHDPMCGDLASVFKTAPRFMGAFTTNPAVDLPNIFDPSAPPSDADYIITMTPEDRNALRANYKGRATVL